MIVRSSLETEGIKLLKCPPPGDDYFIYWVHKKEQRVHEMIIIKY